MKINDLSPPSVQPFTVGTAGHVDHGKSTLVKALTGIDPDRLAEEQARHMTIDLGFAWFTLPSGRPVSVVDVPGHERFIKNMLAGVGGIDAALLVIAADEGPMPQTTEHLAILDLLQIRYGLVALTKSDVVDDDWLDLVTEEVRESIQGTVLADAPIIPVSAVTGAGLSDLRTALDQLLKEASNEPVGARPRLPIDRIFTVAGFGTIVTGTLTGGPLRVGQEIVIAPRGLTSRIRGLESHQHKVETVLPGARVAVNLAGLAVHDLRRGDVVTAPGVLRSSQRLDAHVRLLPDAPVVLEQNALVDFFTGATELPARMTLLDHHQLGPGKDGWVQFRFLEPIAVLKGDRFIIRRPSPSDTIGGGEIIDADPPRHKRFRPEVLSALSTLAQGSADEIVLQALETGPKELRALRDGHLAGLNSDQLRAAVEQLIDEGDVIVLSVRDGITGTNVRPGDYLVATLAWHTLRDQIRGIVDGYHVAQPLRKGIPKEELRNRLRLTPQRLFDETLAVAVREGNVADDGATVRLPTFTIQLDPKRRVLADRYLAALRQAPFSPPSPTEFGLDDTTLNALEVTGEVVTVSVGVTYDTDSYADLVQTVLAIIEREGSITLPQYRDHFGTSRKYAQATLEHLDSERITRRVGDDRVRYVGPNAGSPPSRATVGDREIARPTIGDA